MHELMLKMVFRDVADGHQTQEWIHCTYKSFAKWMHVICLHADGEMYICMQYMSTKTPSVRHRLEQKLFDAIIHKLSVWCSYKI